MWCFYWVCEHACAIYCEFITLTCIGKGDFHLTLLGIWGHHCPAWVVPEHWNSSMNSVNKTWLLYIAGDVQFNNLNLVSYSIPLFSD